MIDRLIGDLQSGRPINVDVDNRRDWKIDWLPSLDWLEVNPVDVTPIGTTQPALSRSLDRLSGDNRALRLWQREFWGILQSTVDVADTMAEQSTPRSDNHVSWMEYLSPDAPQPFYAGESRTVFSDHMDGHKRQSATTVTTTVTTTVKDWWYLRQHSIRHARYLDRIARMMRRYVPATISELPPAIDATTRFMLTPAIVPTYPPHRKIEYVGLCGVQTVHRWK
jgi:hypothetical protein